MRKSFELAEIFNDNMVFQQGKPIKIFGKCAKKQEITIKLLDQEIVIKTKSDNFMVEFPAWIIVKRHFLFLCNKERKSDNL
jgi:hypothetical protein